MKLPINDAWAIRRAFTKQDWSQVEVTPGTKLFLSLANPESDIGWKRMSDVVAADDEILKQIFAIDPTSMPCVPEKLVRANDLKSMTVPEYLLTDYPFFANGFNALVGASGTGKSFVTLDFAAKLAAHLTDGHVVYVAAEGVTGYSPRWEAWKVQNKTDSDRLYFYVQEINMMSMEQVELFIEDIEPLRPVMVILDTVARCMVGADENSTRDMGMFVSHVDKMRRYLDCGVLLVHHTGKDGSMRGNTALYAACDSVVFLTKMDSRIALHNESDKGGKNKYQREAPSRYMALRPITVNINDTTVQSAALVPADQILTMPSDPLTSNEQIILDLLGSGGEYSAKELASMGDLSQSSTYHAIKSLLGKGRILKSENGSYRVPDSNDSNGSWTQNDENAVMSRNKAPDSNDSNWNRGGVRARARGESLESLESWNRTFGKPSNGRRNQYQEGL